VKFSVPTKLSCLTPFCHDVPQVACGIAHPARVNFVPCVKNVVYSIPLTCGKIYVGQSKRCLNHRLQEHARNVYNFIINTNKNKRTSSAIAEHCNACKCSPIFDKTSSIYTNEANKFRRVFLESLTMKQSAKEVVSVPSFNISNVILDFI
jgi:hypothetical protein